MPPPGHPPPETSKSLSLQRKIFPLCTNLQQRPPNITQKGKIFSLFPDSAHKPENHPANPCTHPKTHPTSACALTEKLNNRTDRKPIEKALLLLLLLPKTTRCDAIAHTC
jgi:hypothetical protein